MDIKSSNPDELSFVDEDIKAIYQGKNYLIGTPLLAQLVKELKIINKLLAEYVRSNQ